MKYKIFFTIMTVYVLSLVISATNEYPYIYEYPEHNITIEFEENSIFSPDDRQMIADSIAYNTSVAQPYSLCWLLGHDIYTETVTATYHEKSEYDPRCQLEIYHVEKCTKCDYAYPRLVDSRYITCCPPDASAVSIDDSHTH